MRHLQLFTAVVLSLVMAFTVFPGFASAEAAGSTDKGTNQGIGGSTEATLPEYEAGQLIVVTEQGTSKSQLKEIAGEAEGDLQATSTLGDGSRIGLVEVDEGDELSAVNALNAEDKVLFAQPNYKYELEENELDGGDDDGDINLPEYPNDPYYQEGKQESFSADPMADEDNAGSINAAGAWEQLGNTELADDEKVLVGVVDTGVLRSHEDLQECVLRDKCVAFENGKKIDFDELDDSDDDVGHGTNVTGLIAADINNGVGVAGVAGGRANVIVVDANASKGGIHSIDIMMGVYYLTDQGVRVINLSVGGHTRDLMYERAVRYAWENGTMCICAAGNHSTPHLHSPGDTPYAVQVMAHEPDGTPTEFTGYGVEKDISAPGYELPTTGYLRSTSYEGFSGTSASCPVTVGAVALLLSADPGLTHREIKNLLYTSSGAECFGPKKEGQGFGMINVNTAMQNLLSAEKPDPEKLLINKPTLDMYEGMDTSIEYAVYPGNTNTVDATFSSSNEEVAAVDDYGIITAKTPGNAEIKVNCKGVTAICDVTVRETPYTKITRKPYYTTGTFTIDEMIDYIVETDESGVLQDEDGNFCQQYRIDLKKGETIDTVMYSADCGTFVRIKDMDGNILTEEAPGEIEHYYRLTFQAEEAGTYVLQAFQLLVGGHTTTDYSLKIASDKSFCKPKVNSTDYGQMRMSWPAVKDADCYLVRKYKDKAHKTVESKEFVDAVKYTDTKYNKSKVQYYSVTACLQTSAGKLYCGEKYVTVKVANPMTAVGKTVKVKKKTVQKKNVTLAKAKVLTIKKAKGTVTYAKVSGNKKITINEKTGKVTVKKGLKKGTYTVKVKVKAAGNSKYRAKTKAAAIKVRVK